MNPQLDQLLCGRYPGIFAQRSSPATVSCMGRGFECHDGWFALINDLCARLQAMTDVDGAPQVVAAQVKEKFGELRFYVEYANDVQHALIDEAGVRSGAICEVCGEAGVMLVSGCCHMTRCAAHAPADAVTREAFVATRR